MTSDGSEHRPEPAWCCRTSTGTVLHVWAQPGASRSGLASIHDGCLKIRIAAPPADGRANTEIIRFLANLLKVPRSAVTIQRGASSRRKIVSIANVDPTHVLRQLEAPGG